MTLLHSKALFLLSALRFRSVDFVLKITPFWTKSAQYFEAHNRVTLCLDSTERPCHALSGWLTLGLIPSIASRIPIKFGKSSSTLLI